MCGFWGKLSKMMKIIIICAIVLLFLGIFLVILFLVILPLTTKTALDVPEVQPAVTAGKPAGFTSRRMLRNGVLESDGAGRLLSGFVDTTTVSYKMGVIKERIFQAGPLQPEERLGMVDQRMTELKNRNEEENGRKCVREDPKVWKPSEVAGGFPDGTVFPMYFSCIEKMSEQLTVLFGLKDDYAYIAEIQNYGQNGGDNPTMAVLAKSTKDGDQVEVWQINLESSTSSTWGRLSAKKADKMLEMSVGSQGANVGVGCGFRMNSKDSKLWTVAEFNSEGGNGGSYSCGTNSTSICVDASSSSFSELSDSDCSGLNSFNLGEITYSILSTGSYHNNAWKLISESGVDGLGLTDFNVYNDGL